MTQPKISRPAKQQFRMYALQTKLIVAFLIMSLISVAIVALFANRSTGAALTKNVGQNLSDLAHTQAIATGDLLARQTDLLQSLALSRNLLDRLILANTVYGDDQAANLAAIEEIEQDWINAKDDTDFVIQTRLRNGAAVQLKEFQEKFPDHVELFITDELGGVMAAANRTTDYYQADEAWWQAAYNNGQGALYIGLPEFDERSGVVGVNIAMPFYNDDGEIVGILRSTYWLNALNELLGSVHSGETGHIELYFPNGLELHPESGELIEAEFDLSLFTQPEAIEQGYLETPYEDTPSLVSHAPVSAITGEPEIADLNWQILVRQDRDEALAPVITQTRNTILLAMLVAAVAVVAAVFIAQRFSGPIIRLTATAEQVAAGELTARAAVETGDEIGALATSFNVMTDQLQDTIITLEDRVVERTRQLELVLDIGRQLGGILDLNDLMSEVVTLTKETFNFYHVHIYLLDTSERALTIAEGYGFAGAEMKRQRHSIMLDAPQSLVARAARNDEVVYISDVSADPTWLPNALLPDTSSEMAIPIKLESEVVGVLDVQSDTIKGLTKEDGVTLQLLANQIAVAIHNARLFSETQDALQQAEKLQELYTGQAWDSFSASRSKTNFEIKQAAMPPLEEIPTPEVEQALQKQSTANWRLALADKDADNGNTQNELEQAIATPLKLGEQIIGVLGVRDNQSNRRWTENEIALIESVSEQMSLALENARLFGETRQRAAREEVIANLTQAIWTGDDLDAVLRNSVTRLGQTLGASKVVIRLQPEKISERT